MIKVGLTGTIGSGKSTVARAFTALGVPTYLCDAEAKRLMTSDSELKRELIALLGNDIYFADGTLDRKRVAGIIFNSPELLAQVNAAVHPCVARDFLRWSDEMDNRGFAWVICETAILAESGMTKHMDKVIVTYVKRETQIERAMRRDGASRDDIERRLRNQKNGSELLAMADFVIEPDDKHLILPQLMEIDKALRNE